MSTASRTVRPKMPLCRVTWFAPVPHISCGRSALTTTSGVPEASASATAGCRFATAVPEVVTTATGSQRPSSRAALAMPKAMNAASRSSRWTRASSQPARSAASSA